MDHTAKDENLQPLFPGLLPYGHTIGAPAFRPTEMGVILSKSASAMNEQVEMQKSQILQQLELLKKQYIELEERRIISLIVYQAELRFKPENGHTYYLYNRENGTTFLSMIEPTSWNRGDLIYIASVKLLSDMTWTVIEKSEAFRDIYVRK
jgi:hypothetical protein